MNDEEKKIQAYIDAINARSGLGEQAQPDVSGADDMETKNFEANAQQQYGQVADAGAANAGQGSDIQKAGQLTTGAGAAGANPYVAGAGVVLQGVGMVDSAKRQNEQAKIDAYNKKIMAQRSAVRNLFA